MAPESALAVAVKLSPVTLAFTPWKVSLLPSVAAAVETASSADFRAPSADRRCCSLLARVWMAARGAFSAVRRCGSRVSSGRPEPTPMEEREEAMVYSGFTHHYGRMLCVSLKTTDLRWCDSSTVYGEGGVRPWC